MTWTKLLLLDSLLQESICLISGKKNG